MNLDSNQIEAVESAAQFTLVAAGPGAGKSRVIVERIKRLVVTGIAPASIWVNTFTVAGALELKGRLGGIRLGALGTRHSVLFRMLQTYGGAIGYRKGGINLVAPELEEELLQEAAKFLNWKGSNKALYEAKDPKALLIQRELQHRLKRSNLVTYDGVLSGALKLLESDADIALPSALIIDEAQDDAFVDWEITYAMQRRRPEMTLFVAGDPDQSVFGFRGAYPRGFVDAAATGRLFLLETNYRSAAAICKAATRLIRHNTNRIDKITKAFAQFGTGNITHNAFDTCAIERAAIAMAATKLCHQGERSYPVNEIAVLCRTHAIADQMRSALMGAGVPVRGNGSDRRQLPADFGDAMDVLSLFADPRSDIMAERVLKQSDRPGIVKCKKEEAAKNQIWLSVAAWPEWFCQNTLTPNNGARDRLDDVMKLLPQFGISKETCTLIHDRISLLPQPEPTLVDLRHDLFNNALWDKDEAQQPGVTVSTIHAFKGKEADVVFLPAWEEGVIPSNKKDCDTDEERRLAYVAITRARHEVHISSARTRVSEWGSKNNPPSRFISELNL